jgi:hypothetical protein
VDITRDVMQMQAEGISVEEMKATIDRKYSPFGPSNMQ